MTEWLGWVCEASFRQIPATKGKNSFQAFGTDGRAAIMLKEEMKFDDGIVMEAVVEKFVKYFRSVDVSQKPFLQNKITQA